MVGAAELLARIQELGIHNAKPSVARAAPPKPAAKPSVARAAPPKPAAATHSAAVSKPAREAAAAAPATALPKISVSVGYNSGPKAGQPLAVVVAEASGAALAAAAANKLRLRKRDAASARLFVVRTGVEVATDDTDVRGSGAVRDADLLLVALSPHEAYGGPKPKAPAASPTDEAMAGVDAAAEALARLSLDGLGHAVSVAPAPAVLLTIRPDGDRVSLLVQERRSVGRTALLHDARMCVCVCVCCVCVC